MEALNLLVSSEGKIVVGLISLAAQMAFEVCTYYMAALAYHLAAESP